MPLRADALAEFDLPAAPQRVDPLPRPVPGGEAYRIHAPAGRFLLLLCAREPLSMAFEATLFDLLAESRYPAPRPRRAKSGSMIAQLPGNAVASCYPWPPGEPLDPASATAPQVMEAGRLLARLHQLAEAHPASVSDPVGGASLLEQLPAGKDRDVLIAGLPALPAGAVHGGLRPRQALFSGNRCSAILPSGRACSGPLVLDVAEAAFGWMNGAPNPEASLRALLAGYQALRRLDPDETAALPACLRYAEARSHAISGTPYPT